MKTQSSHRWSFFRAGGFDQVRLESGADLQSLDQLDQKLWLALACPTQGLEFDSKTLALIDTDKDGRIRAPEMIAAAKWAASCLRNPDDLLRGSDSLPLNAINDATDEGKQLLASARQILINLGKGNAISIGLEDTTDTVRIFAQTVFNGDGIIPAESAEDPAVRAVISDIITAVGSETDRSGKPGVNQAKVDQFFTEIQVYNDWIGQAANNAELILPLGENTRSTFAALSAVKAKIDDYFARCRLAAFDTRAIAALNRQESEYLAVAARDMSITADEVAGFPLARIEANKPLPLKDNLNPAWAAAIKKFHAEVVTPLLSDRPSLTEDDWQKLNGLLAPFAAWSAAKPAVNAEKIGLKRVREILAGKTREAINTLIQKDLALQAEANAIASVDKLLRFHRDLFRLANNFVAFRDFYGRKDKAVFQAGTLYLDQRSCDLCLRVEDAARHAAMAALAGTYLAYCDCVRKATGEKMNIVAAFTNGDSDNLMVGRNGIFYDRAGRDWDATITKIIDNPISVRQAFWSPYKRFVRMIEEQVAKRAAAADAASTQKLSSAATNVANADTTKPAEPRKMDVGVVAALGVAVGAIGTAVSALVTGVLKLPGWQLPLVFAGLMLVVSGPSMVIAWLKLRKRNLGPILDANGWAVNARAKINLPFGASLTRVAVLPPGSARTFNDPFAESHKGRNRFIALIIIATALWAAWNFGAIERVIPGKLPKSKWLQNREAKAAAAAAATTTTTITITPQPPAISVAPANPAAAPATPATPAK